MDLEQALKWKSDFQMICIWWFNFFCNLILKIDQIELSNWSDPFLHSQQLLSECYSMITILKSWNFTILNRYANAHLPKCMLKMMITQSTYFWFEWKRDYFTHEVMQNSRLVCSLFWNNNHYHLVKFFFFKIDSWNSLQKSNEWNLNW